MSCPIGVIEIWIYFLVGVGIFISNGICLIVKIYFKSRYHRENNYYMINLTTSNMFCGITWMFVAIARMYSFRSQNIICKILLFARTFFTYLPFVCLVAMGLDVAYYCHYALSYSVKMTKRKVFTNIIFCWFYTLLVGILSFGVQSDDFCVPIAATNRLSRLKFIAYPVLCMLIPGISAILAFVFIKLKYQSKNVKQHYTMPAAFRERCHLSRFLINFFHLTIVCVISGFIHTSTLIANHILEKEGRSCCWIFYLNFAALFPNCLLAPWFYCLAKREFRRKILTFFVAHLCRKQIDNRIKVKVEGSRCSPCCANSPFKSLFVSPLRHHKVDAHSRSFRSESALHSTPPRQFPSTKEESVVVILHNGGIINEAIRNGISTSVPPGVLMAPPAVTTVSETIVPRQINNVIPDIVLLYKPSTKAKDDFH